MPGRRLQLPGSGTSADGVHAPSNDIAEQPVQGGSNHGGPAQEREWKGWVGGREDEESNWDIIRDVGALGDKGWKGVGGLAIRVGWAVWILVQRDVST